MALAVLPVSSATISLGLLALFADHEQQALLFALGGAGLAAWAGLTLCLPPRR